MIWTFLKGLSITQYIVAGLLVLLGVQTLRIGVEHRARLKAEQQERASHLGQLNAEALLDTTRKTTGDSLKILGDSLVLFQRKAVQEAQKASGLDKALGEAAVANYKLTVKLDSFSAQVVAPVTVSKDSLLAHWSVKRPPYHVEADVALPQTGSGRLNLDITQDPLGLRVKVGCGQAVRGVKEANVSVLGPAYASIRLDSLSQSPEVCSPAPTVEKSHSVRTTILMGLSLVLGWVLHR